jgi:hypothetical protein
MPKVTLKNTQIGMRYSKCITINSDSKWDKKKEIWDKYYNEIANKEIADERVISGQ